MKNDSLIKRVIKKILPMNTRRGNFARRVLLKFKDPFHNTKMHDSKIKMILRLVAMSILHPKRAYELFFEIKKGKIHFGDHHADICYLAYGKIIVPKEEKPLVSIVIPVYNQYVYTYKCLKSISDYTKDVKYEIIIGDDLSNDGIKYLSSYVKNINIVRNDVNLKFLKNCNNAAKKARGKYILFLNNDTQVTENWLSSLISLIESDNKIGMVGSKLVFPNGLLQEAGGIICSDGAGYNYGKFDDANKPQYNYVREVDYISGASIMLYKKLWDEIGGFDELFAPAYCEDSDLAFEIRKRGLKVVYQPKSVVVHYEGVSNGVDVNNATSLKHYQIENNRKLMDKWQKEFRYLPSSKLNKSNIQFRDRLNGRKTILVIDHFVPEYDKDAGSKTTYQYLKMFVEKGYIVKFLGDNFYQSEPYTSELQQMGIEVLYGIDYKNTINDWIIENKDNIDVAYLNRPHISVKYIDFIKENTDIKIIYYGHDLHFLREKREYEITKDEKHLVDSDYWKEIELGLMRKSDQVYYPSKVEENLIKSIDDSINVKAISAYIFDKVDIEKQMDFENRKGIMFVGGFNHRPNVDAVLWFMKEIYPCIRKNEDIPFYIVGSNPPEQIKNLKNEPGVIFKGYVTDEELKNLYEKCKLVVVPLRYGAGIKGKVVEAMSMGVPIVTTSTGAEGIHGLEKIVPVTDEPKEFANELLEIYNDNKKLSDISFEERNYIHKKFGTNAAWNIIKDDFNKKYKYLVFTPDGYGSKGDEAMIRGVLNFVEPNITKIITQRKELWSDKLNMIKNLYDEEFYELKEFENAVTNEKIAFILGADLIDGTQEVNASISRLKAARKIAENGGVCHIFCSFRKDVSPEIIKFIKALPKNVKFYLRDEISYKNFINLTRKKCEYFPDLAFVSETERTIKVIEIENKINELKLDYNLIGVNFSETSFRSLYENYTDENRKKYVSEVIERIIKNIDNPYIVLVCHDTRCWDGYYSDDDYNKIALEYCEKKNFENVIKLDADLMHTEITEVLTNLDTVITGRMHLSIAAFKAGIIPIIYTGSGKQKFSMNDKMHGMFINRLGNDTFVTHDLNSLSNAINKAIYNYYDCLNFLEHLDKMKENDKKELEKLKIKILENNKE